MTVEDDPVHDVLAALSYYLSRPLPEPLADLERLHRDRPGESPSDYRARVLHAAGSGDRTSALRALGRSLRERADEARISLLIRGDAGWPAHVDLDQVPCLWVRGNPDLHTTLTHSVTVTGARAATDEGKFLAAQIGSDLADAGLTVVTGLSVGIDAAAAAAAFSCSTAPVLVAAGGLDQHPGPELRNLAGRAVKMSSLISPFPPGCDRITRRWNYRDTLLGRLSAATVLIEASTSAGTATAHAASTSGRLVFAVPGSGASAAWSSCAQLVADGIAQPVAGPAAVLAALRAAAGHGPVAMLGAFGEIASTGNSGMRQRPAEPAS
ncbi:DNA-processing protein DprA [Paractinoplanes globisporus]|uniref:DNA-processing protein DprA n=1 Tax=Paractinoplanes globisporus TaxID=113565 RepID=A0ABW6WHL5_9ACTN|nr:DNA-processing protein DprA [Actinoplanes globisporus]